MKNSTEQRVEILIEKIRKKHRIKNVEIIDALGEYLTAPKYHGWEKFLAATEPLLPNAEWQKLCYSTIAAKYYMLPAMEG